MLPSCDSFLFTVSHEGSISNRRSLFFHGKFLFVRNVLAKEDFSSKTIGSVRTSDAKLFLIKLQEDGKGYSTIKSVPGSVLQG